MLRFRLMVKRGPQSWPQASEGEAQHGLFCRIRCSVKETRAFALWMIRAGLCGSEKVGERTGGAAAGSDDPRQPSSGLGCMCRYRSGFLALAEAGLPVICVETRHMRAVLKAQINKTDRNDARHGGYAGGLSYRPVHVKTLRSQKLRMLLTHRKLLQSKAIAIDNDLRATLRNFGLVAWWEGQSSRPRIKEPCRGPSCSAVLVEPLAHCPAGSSSRTD